MTKNPSNEVRVYLLGAMRVEVNGQAVRLPRRKVESLLAWLILHPRGQTRDYLATLLWGDSSDTQARHSLRTALATLRSEVGADLVRADRTHVQLNPDAPLWVDLRDLLALERDAEGASGERIAAALTLWQGDLLDGNYDDWVDAERQHYNERLNALFLGLAQVLRGRSAYRQAIAVAQRLLQHDSANEEAHQHLIFCHVALGDRAAAQRQYEACERAILEELDAPPSPETVALYQWIRQQETENAAAALITNLPIPLTTFIGRAQETAEIKRLIMSRTSAQQPASAPVRLLTLIGPGGTGKTRLAIHAAADLIDAFADGVWWVELAALEEDAGVARAIAKALGVVEKASTPLVELLASAIDQRKMLLVLDNCEHLISACAAISATLLERCPNLQVLATSREPLNSGGEILWQVPAFAVPEPDRLGVLDLLMRYESLRLFVERATAVRSDFTLTLENAPAIVEICHRLDGIPLAIELAAARVRMLSVQEIAAVLSGAIGARFALLTQGTRTVMPRHQTLRATIDWSYDLLDEDERNLFRQAAIFQGGFTLQRLQEVVQRAQNQDVRRASGPASSHNNGVALLDPLGQLADKSLVVVEPQDKQNRYRMLETLREYALESYPSPQALETMQRAHAHHYLELAEAAKSEMMRADQRKWLTLLETDHANLRAALRYLINTADADGALRMATALQRFWDYRGYATEGCQWLREALLLRDGATPELVGAALNGAGWLAYRQGQLDEARRMHEEALHLFQMAEEAAGAAESMRLLASMQVELGELESAARLAQQSLDLYTQVGDEQGMAFAYALLGHLNWDLDRFEEAEHFHAAALEIDRKLENQISMAFELLALGDVRRMMKRYDASQSAYEESLALAQTVGHRGLVGGVYKSMGMLAVRRGRFDLAQEYGETALATFRELGDRAHIGFSYSHLGDVARNLDDHETALRYYIQYLQSMVTVGIRWATFNAIENIAWMLAELRRDGEEGARLLGLASAIREELGIPGTDFERNKIAAATKKLEEQLGAERFAAARAAGRGLSAQEAVAIATRLTPEQNPDTGDL